MIKRFIVDVPVSSDGSFTSLKGFVRYPLKERLRNPRGFNKKMHDFKLMLVNDEALLSLFAKEYSLYEEIKEKCLLK